MEVSFEVSVTDIIIILCLVISYIYILNKVSSNRNNIAKLVSEVSEIKEHLIKYSEQVDERTMNFLEKFNSLETNQVKINTLLSENLLFIKEMLNRHDVDIDGLKYRKY